MSVDEIDLDDFFKVLLKELGVSIIIGLALSSLNFIRICYIEKQGVMVALTVCAAMLVIVVAAKLIGSMLPMLAKRIGIDPALMATPTISSLTDMVSVITYFTLAKIFLNI